MRKCLVVLRMLLLAVGWCVPMLCFLEFFLNEFFQIEIRYFRDYLPIIILVWIVVFLVNLFLLFRYKRDFYVFLAVSLLCFGLCYYWASSYKIYVTRAVANTNYKVRIYFHRYEIWQEHTLYLKLITRQKSEVFFTETSKIGIDPLSQIRVFSEDEKRIILKLEGKMQSEFVEIPKD
ncbi:MAG: hypothetical protein Q4B43_01815 [Bacteroidota bacterium]|nr:hypothetical protein [Bacteroidota bacterium]